MGEDMGRIQGLRTAKGQQPTIMEEGAINRPHRMACQTNQQGKKMTVQQLVEVLQALPGNKEVMFLFPGDSEGMQIKSVEFDFEVDTEIYLIGE